MNFRSMLLALCCGVFFSFAVSGCGGTSQSSPGPSPTPTPLKTDHVFVVVLENQSFSAVIGNPAAPFLNSLASQHSLATQFFANTHPSIGNYFMLTTGQIISNDDSFSGTVADDNVVRALAAAGKTWKAYMESIPSVGYTGQDVYPYRKHHNPFSYFTDVLNSPAALANMVPFPQIVNDVGAGSLPSFAFIVPNEEHNAHDCPDGSNSCANNDKVAAADQWLQANIGPLINNSGLANSVFIITWDESFGTDMANGGGQIATVLVGARVKPAFSSNTFFQHQSTLKLVLDLLGVSDHPGASANAADMSGFFQ
jgi:phosphatidylinositol-3-phosphatase